MRLLLDMLVCTLCHNLLYLVELCVFLSLQVFIQSLKSLVKVLFCHLSRTQALHIHTVFSRAGNRRKEK